MPQGLKFVVGDFANLIVIVMATKGAVLQVVVWIAVTQVGGLFQNRAGFSLE